VYELAPLATLTTDFAQLGQEQRLVLL